MINTQKDIEKLERIQRILHALGIESIPVYLTDNLVDHGVHEKAAYALAQGHRDSVTSENGDEYFVVMLGIYGCQTKNEYANALGCEDFRCTKITWDDLDWVINGCNGVLKSCGDYPGFVVYL